MTAIAQSFATRGWQLDRFMLPLVFLLVELVGLTLHPLVWGDEAMLNDPGLQLVRTGHFRSDVFRSIPNYERFYFWQPPGLGLLAAGSYLGFGFGIWQTRLPGILFGSLAVGLVQHLTTRAFASRRAGWLAGLLVMTWPPFVTTARAARMDTPCVALLLLATAILFSARREEKSLAHSVCAGLAAGMAGLMHSVALPWLVSLLVVQWFFLDRQSARLFALGTASVVPALGWFWNAWRFPAEFRDQFLFVVQGRTATSSLPLRLVEEVQRCFRDYAATPLILLCLLVTGLILWRRRGEWTHELRMLVVGIGVIFLGVALLAGKGSGFYNLYYTLPALMVISGAAALPGLPGSSTWIQTVALAGALLLLFNCAVKSYLPRVVAVTVQREARDYERAFAPLSRLLKPGDQVWGEGMAWPACVLAGARLDIRSGAVPIKGESHPDPARHRFVVIDGAVSDPPSGFRQILQVDRPLPPVFGRTFSNDHYRYEVWQSAQIP